MLQADDLEVGLLVTVLENKPVEIPLSPFGDLFGNAGGEIATRKYSDRGGMGGVLIITSVMYPYIVLRDVRPMPPFGYFRRTMDIRTTHLMKVTEEFARASLGTDWQEQVTRAAQTQLGG